MPVDIKSIDRQEADKGGGFSQAGHRPDHEAGQEVAAGVPDAIERAHRHLADASALLHELVRDRDRWRRRYRDEQNKNRARSRSDHAVHRLARLLLLIVRNPREGFPRAARALSRRLGRAQPDPQRSAAGLTQSSATGLTQITKQSRKTTPQCVYHAFDFDIDGLRELTRVVAQTAVVMGNHTPIIVTDCIEFSLVRDTGVVFEYVPDRSIWPRYGVDMPWDTFRRVRLARLAREHEPAMTLAISRDHVPGLSELLTLHHSVIAEDQASDSSAA